MDFLIPAAHDETVVLFQLDLRLADRHTVDQMPLVQLGGSEGGTGTV